MVLLITNRLGKESLGFTNSEGAKARTVWHVLKAALYGLFAKKLYLCFTCPCIFSVIKKPGL
jgi:hypothetical protein